VKIVYEPTARRTLLASAFLLILTRAAGAQEKPLCLDGFCIGQTIQDTRFNSPTWILPPKKELIQDECTGIGCKPENAFRGYPRQDQIALAAALSWHYGLNQYNVVTKENLQQLRHYTYECNSSARGGIWGQRRFIGIYRSAPSGYLTIVGLRLINGELRVYRIARQFPYHNPEEIQSLAQQLRTQFGDTLLIYDGISSNAYSDVIAQRKSAWFGRSTMFNPSDLSNNAAELVLIDTNTRDLLEPSSMPDSGEIKPLPVRIPEVCNREMPLQ